MRQRVGEAGVPHLTRIRCTQRFRIDPVDDVTDATRELDDTVIVDAHIRPAHRNPMRTSSNMSHSRVHLPLGARAFSRLRTVTIYDGEQLRSSR